MRPLRPPGHDDDWLALTTEPIPVAAVYAWALRPECGAVVLFGGTVRDHAPGRPGVTALEYEAYEEQAVSTLAAIAQEARRRWPSLGRIALLHRVGRLDLTETAVVVAVSAPHRPEAFAAARYGIDAVKATVPIWKQETWSGGTDWGTDATDLRQVSANAEAAPDLHQPDVHQKGHHQERGEEGTSVLGMLHR